MESLCIFLYTIRSKENVHLVNGTNAAVNGKKLHKSAQSTVKLLQTTGQGFALQTQL